MTSEIALELLRGQVRYILHDPQISRAKKMLTIEQFQNPQMTAQLCLPLSVWINLCDRDSEHEDDVMKLIDRHIRQFFELYRAG